MITPGYAKTMARYNAWQNLSLFTAADGLSEAERQRDRGAFFGSIQGTLSHLMWGDLIWIARFDGGDGPVKVASGADTANAYDWPVLMRDRPLLDARIAAWADSVTEADLQGDLAWYSGMLGRELSRPKALCVMQLFNHETHHRGQVHAMLTDAGAKPDDTDLQLLPDEVPAWP